MIARTTAWLVMVAAALGACDVVDDDDWERQRGDGWGRGDDWDNESTSNDGPPSQSSPPSNRWTDAGVPRAPTPNPRALVPAISWRSGDAGVEPQQVAVTGLFPDAFTLQTTSLRPPAEALTLLFADQPYGGGFAYGDIVALRPSPAATPCAPCSTLPCASTTPTCSGVACGSASCQRGCGSSSCTTCAGRAQDAGCRAAPVLPTPPTIEGVVTDYVVLYNDREIAAGTLLAGVFNDYRSLAPGLHLIRIDALTSEQQQQALLCRDAAAERAVERYNARERTSYADEEQLLSELGLRVTLGELAAGECALEYERLRRTSYVEQRCRFGQLAMPIDAPTGCALRVSFGAPLPPPLLPTW